MYDVGRERRSVVLAQSQLMPCVGDRIRRMRARMGESAARAGGAPTSPSAAASVVASAAAAKEPHGLHLVSTRTRSLLLGHLGGQGFRGGCAVVAGGDLEYCSCSNNPKAKAPSCTAVSSPSFRGQLGSFGEGLCAEASGAAEGSEGIEEGEGSVRGGFGEGQQQPPGRPKNKRVSLV